MTSTLKHGAAAALASALLAAGSSPTFAHPSFVQGGIPNTQFVWYNNTPTGYQAPTKASPRGYWEDAIRIGHGCNLDGSEDDVNDSPVVANSWIWPKGINGLAPMSTGCSAAGNLCTGAGTQPSIARIPDSAVKAHLPAGQGTATTLEAELVGGNTSCTTDPVTHVQSCTSSPGTTPYTNVGYRMQFQGNMGYFKHNFIKYEKDKSGRTYGFYAHGNKYDAEQLKAMGIGSAGAPYQNAIQVLWAETQDTSKVAPFYFSAASCARKLVIRPAGADLCKLHASVKKYNEDPHLGNFWFGGPTPKFKDGHGIHENFWLRYTLMTRDTKLNPYGASCKDKVNGDYDLVVMTTIEEIDEGVPFPGFANKP